MFAQVSAVVLNEAAAMIVQMVGYDACHRFHFYLLERCVVEHLQPHVASAPALQMVR